MFDLALALGKTLGEIGGLSSRELTAWKAYSRIRPFGERAADVRAAQVERAVWASAHPDAFSDKSLDDFTLQWVVDEPKPQSVEEQKAAAKLAEEVI